MESSPEPHLQSCRCGGRHASLSMEDGTVHDICAPVLRWLVATEAKMASVSDRLDALLEARYAG